MRLCISPYYCESRMLKEIKPCIGRRSRKNLAENRDSEKVRVQTEKGAAQFHVLYHLQSFVYSDWSEWSPCTRSCKSRRYRACEMPLVCGTTVIYEDVLCYVKESFCDKFYHKKEKRDKQKETKEKIEIQNRKEHFTFDNKECGKPVTSSPDLRIVGGHEAQKGRWPWQVSHVRNVLNRFMEPFCGGTLIAPQWVLTAAHCVRRRLYIRAGEYDLLITEVSEQEIKVSDSFVHPNYDIQTINNDIALLRLRQPLTMNVYVQVACLPSVENELHVQTMATILGWGKQRKSAIFGTDVLHEAQVPIVGIQDCRQVYQDYYISENMLCAGYKKGQIDSCAGDSGGPLLYKVNEKWEIHGITSFGEGCGKMGKYGIYSKVINFVEWIKEIIAINS
ncbi:serine protease 1 [Tachypleus tridentatus]|uniref:serine protease 1 n=1 Tax=Tachypleus tridentatus TaxID=6853 RepID=UPI003FD1C89A